RHIVARQTRCQRDYDRSIDDRRLKPTVEISLHGLVVPMRLRGVQRLEAPARILLLHQSTAAAMADFHAGREILEVRFTSGDAHKCFASTEAGVARRRTRLVRRKVITISPFSRAPVVSHSTTPY